ncbi:hypothetical protein HG536_0A03050 [Torulaspora globosa]|uniref:Uncharacterized protein n=1 Tax=Torulaspora globosa TaxID=48254 RepID=A0A7G3ZAF2_9SACH|nr:uncharacterized protein HG536_0A03050 [Torulaspora globosa]QLL30488.1 hypothetical protein HG536_0A03050 [Torulaspora globosa]
MGTVVNSRTRIRDRPFRSFPRHNGLNWDNEIFSVESSYNHRPGGGGGFGTLPVLGGSSDFKEQRVFKLEPIKETPGDHSTPELQVQDSALAETGARSPEIASLTAFKGNLRKRWTDKMCAITKKLDFLQSKMFDLIWVSILYLNYLYPQISRFVEYVSQGVPF